jgi:hypothetical protein
LVSDPQILRRRRIVEGEIGVEAPSQTFIETLGAIDVGYWNDDDLELQFGRRDARGCGTCSSIVSVLLIATS